MKKSTDFLVIGSGIAGLYFAIKASKFGKVIIVTKKKVNDCNTRHAQGGIACVLDPDDSFELHKKDTLTTGGGLSDAYIVDLLVKEGPDRLKDLVNLGADFTRSSASHAYKSLDLGREGGHSKHRVVHAQDMTGREIESTLLKKVKAISNITIYENHTLVELITNHHIKSRKRNNCCYGAYIFDANKKRIFPILAKTTTLATGGAGTVYAHTTNDPIATGDGIACAFRAGARIENMEFIQFHPTTLYHSQANSFLISEALRGYGAILKTRSGEEFMAKYHPMKSLAPRDVVARAIDKEIKKSGDKCVYLDIRHADPTETKNSFPNIYKECLNYGIDITKEPIPVVPASHYTCGGIHVDRNGNTDIQNLYAIGETANTGVHGANRLASNSLLEAVVFSKFAAEDAGCKLKDIKLPKLSSVPIWDDSGTTDTEEWVLISHNLDEIKKIMWNYVGIVRSDLRLERALRRIKLLEKETEDFYKRTIITLNLLELRNIITVAKLIVLSALKRRESRGLHFTTDYPELNNRFYKKNTVLSNQGK